MRNNTRATRRLLITASGIICVAALFCLAIVFPKLYYRHYDNNILERASFMDINVSAYEVNYDSFGEKLRALLGAADKKGGVRAVQVDEMGFEVSREDMTKIANRELKIFSKKTGFIHFVKLKKKDLAVFERYIFYGANEEDSLKGISCWKLVYKNKERELTLFLDEEYHKIYYLKNHGEELYPGVVSVARGYRRGYDEGITDDGQITAWWERLLAYYGFTYQEDTIMRIDESTVGRTVIYGEKYTLIMCSVDEYDETGAQIREIGLEIMKMIQF